MKILRVNPANPDPRIIRDARDVLRFGGVVAYPTDTCYGLGADMSNIIGVDKIYKIKKRSTKRPFSIIVGTISDIKKICLVDEKQEKILRKFLPGAITFILLNLEFKTFPQNTIAVRIPNYKITRLLAESFCKPFATTSANIAGKNPCYSIDKFLAQLGKTKNIPDLILDAGELENNKPSTIVNLIKWPPRIIRQGTVEFET